MPITSPFSNINWYIKEEFEDKERYDKKYRDNPKNIWYKKPKEKVKYCKKCKMGKPCPTNW